MPESVTQLTLAVLRCPACGTLDCGPRELCSQCGEAGLAPHDVPADGVLAAWTVIRRPPIRFRGEGPYAIAVVDLSCGLRVTGRLNHLPDAIRPGAALVATAQREGVIIFEERQT